MRKDFLKLKPCKPTDLMKRQNFKHSNHCGRFLQMKTKSPEANALVFTIENFLVLCLTYGIVANNSKLVHCVFHKQTA